MVRLTHPAHLRGQMVTDVAQLVDLAAADDRVVEYLGDGCEGLGAVEDHDDRLRGVQAPVA